MSAIRRLAGEAADNGFIETDVAAAIGRVKGVKRLGTRTGNWLTVEQAEQMLALTAGDSLRAKRDRVLLCLLIGCGLRREELSELTIDHVNQRDGRWMLVDLVGKGNRLRTVPMPAWCKDSIDRWIGASGITDGRLLRQVNKGDRVTGKGMSPQSVFDVVVRYGAKIGFSIAPHDLRRSFAKLAHKGKASVEQIQMSLGHSSIQTTEKYLGFEQDLADAPCDHLGLRV